ncbi:MAG: hypothetical protein WAK61_01555 [Leclercia sp.]
MGNENSERLACGQAAICKGMTTHAFALITPEQFYKEQTDKADQHFVDLNAVSDTIAKQIV